MENVSDGGPTVIPVGDTIPAPSDEEANEDRDRASPRGDSRGQVPGVIVGDAAEPKESPSLLSLERDVLLTICDYLEAVDLARLSRVCKELRLHTSDSEIWKRQAKRRWGTGVPRKLPKRASWKDYYHTRQEEIGKNWKSGECTFTCLWGHKGKICTLSFNDRFLASGSADTNVMLWDLFPNDEGRDRHLRTFTGHTRMVTAVRLSSRSLVSSSSDWTIKKWDLEAGTGTDMWNFHDEMSENGSIHDLVIRPRQPDVVLAALSDTTIRLFDFRANVPISGVLRGHDKLVFCLTWDGDNTVISGSMDKSVRIWDLRKNMARVTSTKHKKSVTALFWDGTSPHAFSASADRTARQFSVADGKGKRFGKNDPDNNHTAAITSICAVGNTLVTGSNDRSVRVWSVRKGKHLHCFGGYSGDVFAMQCSRDLIVSGSVRTCNIWDFSQPSAKK